MKDPVRFMRAAARDRRSGFFMDLDGTLAAIVRDPAAARPVRGAKAALRALVDAGARVFIISGRPTAFLVKTIGVSGITYAGLYGAEERSGRLTWLHPSVVDARPAVVAAAARLRRELPGLYVEDKGYAVAVHSRRAADPVAALRDARPVVRAVSKEFGLGSIAPGRMVLEIGARGAPTKGTTLARICERERLQRAVVAGDDAGDVAMFESARASVSRSLSIWVRNPEVPVSVGAAADATVASQVELVALLRDCAR